MTASGGGGRGLILLRTHFVDDRVAELARRYGAGGDYDVMIAVDETLGAVDCRGLAKLSMSLDSTARLGLPATVENVLWRCGDYVFYHALPHASGYRYVWLVEYDVVVNFGDPLDFFRQLDARAGEDLLCADLQAAPADWWWRKMTARRFAVPYSAIFPLVRLTPSAMARLYARRRFEGERLRALDLRHEPNWLNDEGFVASFANEAGMPMADFNAYGDFYSPQTFAQKLLTHLDDVPAPDGRLYHAVRWGEGYLRACLSYYKTDPARLLTLDEAGLPGELFVETLASVLATRLIKTADDPVGLFAPGGALAAFPPHLGRPAIASATLRALGKARMRVTLEAAQNGRLAVAFARVPESDNVALGRDAWQSSVSARARVPDPRLDAEGGNDGDRSVEYGFHTAFEERPWWAVDLAAPYPLRAVRLFNRKFAEGRLRGFQIDVSTDFLTWRTVHAHDPEDRAALFAEPIEIAFAAPVEARYVRVLLPRRGTLQLAEVEVIRA